MEFQVVIPVLISFAISVVLGPVIIPFLRRLKMGQTERTEGVQSHLKKAGTPTMGGVIFLIATAITALFYVGDYPKIIPVLFLTLGFGIIVEKEQEMLADDIEALIAERQAARKERNFARADEIRDELLAKGIILEDTREGVKWKRA